ncbi:flagellar basal body P-ring formation protein FlgA [candidate division GN15 bacterium]|nr:flagellar basal body P-ring formation protein FlgA [candidate division GN15 bacterium]
MERLRKIIFWILILTLSSISIAAASPKDDVIDWVIDTYELDPEWYEFEVLTGRLDHVQDDVTVVVDKALTRKDPIGLFSVLTTITDAAGNTEQAQVRLRITRFAEVVCATDRFGRFDLMQADRLTVERRDITRLREQPLLDVNNALGLRAARNIRRGDIVTMRDIEAIPDVEAGNDVTIVFEDGPCTITALGKALETGYRGEIVRVRNSSSGKIITAEISDNNSVTVTP